MTPSHKSDVRPPPGVHGALLRSGSSTIRRVPLFRKSLFTDDWTIHAAERSRRPNAFDTNPSSPVSSASHCPFCAGHEGQTPPEVSRREDPSGWTVRVVPNLYPAVDSAASPFDPSATESEAVGQHEVIIESPRHETQFEDLRDEAVRDVIATWTERSRILSDERRWQATILFRNHGRHAGESIPHLHSQIIALPFVPPRLAAEQAAFETAEICPLCNMLEDPRTLEIARNDSFLWIAPFASRMPYQQWIVPRTHRARFDEIGPAEIRDLGTMLQRATRTMRTRLNDPSWNWSVQTAPAGAARFHWFMEITPRLTINAGFELATGSSINIVDPAHARDVLSES